jgi:curved DNA-binding protein CbpA
MMPTLYDLLGALPKDSADDLRSAFRRAVKGVHPDLHPGDPDAAEKFREIVHASGILGDDEQRAAYNHLLELARLEMESATGRAAAVRMRKLASGVIALAGVSVVTVGGYLLFMHMSAASLAPSDGPAMPALAFVSSAPVTGASEGGDGSAGVPVQPIAPDTAVVRTDSGPAATPNAAPAERGGSSNFVRLRKFDRAFADIAPAQPIEKPVRARPASATTTARPVVPLPRQRPVAQDPSRLESAVLMRRQRHPAIFETFRP